MGWIGGPGTRVKNFSASTGAVGLQANWPSNEVLHLSCRSRSRAHLWLRNLVIASQEYQFGSIRPLVPVTYSPDKRNRKATL